MYLNYRNFSVDFSEETGEFRCLYTAPGEKAESVFLREGAMYVTSGGRRHEIVAYRSRRREIVPSLECLTGTVSYSGSSTGGPDLAITFRLDEKSLRFGMMARAELHVSGLLVWGAEPERATFGVRLDSDDRVLRAACGPAVASCDDALFDRLTDRALEFRSAGSFRVCYDWAAENYRFDYVNGLDFGREFTFRIHEEFCRRKFNIPYAPIRKSHGFETPPVGWMSWYALQFGTCARSVQENVEKLVELFAPWSEKLCCWVDWEWSHDSWSAAGIPGVDCFHPRRDIYPEGLAPVAAGIRKLGVIPALWVGPTNDGDLIASYREHPDWVLGEKKEWCGRYWIDPTHPGVLREYIPAVFRQVLDWGFRMIKWDCLPATLNACDDFHDRFHDSTRPTDAAVRDLVRAARETVGPDCYMLSCSGETERDICFAMDQFSAARISGDIFSWENFLSSAVERLFHCYVWHNVVLYADADNLVLREEFNTMAQARSRVSLYGLAGLPVTMGDDLRTLPPERCGLLRRILPTVDIHPMDLSRKQRGTEYALLNLAVCRRFGSWNVAAVTNFTAETLRLTLHLGADLRLDCGEGRRYAVCDYWNQSFLGLFAEALPLEVSPCDTAVLRITPFEGRPEIIFTSRHLTQGAVELRDVRRTEDGSLSGTALCVPGEEWRMMVLLPEGWELLGADSTIPMEISRGEGGLLLDVVFHPEREKEVRWELRFRH